MIEGYMFALGAAFFSGVAAIIEKKVLFKSKALSFSFVLALFNLLFSIPFFFFVDYSTLSFISLGVLFFKSILGAFAFLCVMIGIKNLEISRALPMLVLTPGLVAFFAFIFLGESLKLIEIFGMTLLLIGTSVLQLGKENKLFAPWKNFWKLKGNNYIIIALFLFTLTSILDKALLRNFKVPVNAFLAFQHLFLAIIFILLVFIFRKASDVKSSFKFSWIPIVVLAFITIAYRYGHIHAVKLAPVALVLSIKRISVFFAILIGGRMFKDQNLLTRVLATTIMIVGAVLIILN